MRWNVWKHVASHYWPHYWSHGAFRTQIDHRNKFSINRAYIMGFIVECQGQMLEISMSILFLWLLWLTGCIKKMLLSSYAVSQMLKCIIVIGVGPSQRFQWRKLTLTFTSHRLVIWLYCFRFLFRLWSAEISSINVIV